MRRKTCLKRGGFLSLGTAGLTVCFPREGRNLPPPTLTPTLDIRNFSCCFLGPCLRLAYHILITVPLQSELNSPCVVDGGFCHCGARYTRKKTVGSSVVTDCLFARQMYLFEFMCWFKSVLFSFSFMFCSYSCNGSKQLLYDQRQRGGVGNSGKGVIKGNW